MDERGVLWFPTIQGPVGIALDEVAVPNQSHPVVIEGVTDRPGTLTLACRYGTDGSSKLKVVRPVPKERRLHSDRVDDAFKGKKGKEIHETLAALYSEVAGAEQIRGIKTQKAAKELIQDYAEAMPAASTKSNAGNGHPAVGDGRTAASGVEDQRVDVELLDLRVPVHQLRQT